jgi:hypothetical protein
MLTKYLFVIAYALAAALDDSSFATVNGSNYDYWKIERCDPDSTSLKLWHNNGYSDEKWTFCGQFDTANQRYYEPSEFESEDDWL